MVEDGQIHKYVLPCVLVQCLMGEAYGKHCNYFQVAETFRLPRGHGSPSFVTLEAY